MAKAFRFRLAPILKLRAAREDERKRVVAATLREMTEITQSKARVLEQIVEQVNEMRRAQWVGRIEPGQVARHRFWLSHLQRSTLESDGVLRTLQARLAQERAELAETAKQRKILSTLEERQRESFRRTRDRAEQREMDEIATTIHRFGAHESEAAST